MVIRIEPAEKKKELLGIFKTKLHGKGFVVIPSEVRKALRLERGTEFVVEVSDDKVILRPIKEATPVSINLDLEDIDTIRQEAWLFRGAYGDAYEFFKKLARTLKRIYGKEFDVGEDRALNKVYLQLEEGNLQDSTHFAYFEDLTYREGVITLVFRKGEEPQRLIEEFLALIPERLKSSLKTIRKEEIWIGLKVIQYPRFDEEELGLLTYLASKVLEHAYVHET